ncbi:MAG: DNA repair protein RecN [Oscillospiraceae bacterium]|nr:DNA repair protein RecN [Oscillospiraceae bacterium]
MLSLLHIENIAVIEAADIAFDRGFNVLTGETGAGKSIVIDAIGAVIGERTSRDLIRTGAKSAVVQAVFTDLPALDWFDRYGVGPDENGELLIQRELQPDGRNTCRVNGKVVTVAQLRQLGTQLLNIHGQHDGQLLLDAANHLGYLDSFGETAPLLSAYQESYSQVSALRKEIASLEMNEAEKARRIDTLNYQIRELERAELRAGEEEELSERRNLLRAAGKLNDAIQEVHRALLGDESCDGALSLLSDAEGAVRSAARYTERLSDLAETLNHLSIATGEAVEEMRELEDEFDFAPEELDQLESRLDTLYRLKKKYGGTEEEMLDYLERCRQELDEIACSTDTIARLEKKLSKARTEAEQQAERLSQARQEKAKVLEQRIQTELSQLDMPRVQFRVQFASKAGILGMDETGKDEVQFLMSANVGEALKPIQKIASGGELARIMLALKNVLAENELVSTMVFDEVDTGVSGRAARKVAQKMASVARYKQVLCVTHLPQIAAMADTHFSVEKGEADGRTYTVVTRLNREQRREELARLTGGAMITETMLRSAEELLEDGETWKKESRAHG